MNGLEGRRKDCSLTETAIRCQIYGFKIITDKLVVETTLWMHLFVLYRKSCSVCEQTIGSILPISGLMMLRMKLL